MSRSHLGLTLLPLLTGAVLVGACHQDPVAIGLALHSAQALANATRVTLDVIDADQASCNPSSGYVDSNASGDAVQSFELDKGGCAGGATWCKTITLEKDDSSKVFKVLAYGSGNVLMSQGCTTAVIDQDPLEVNIDMRRAVAPPCCNDGTIQPLEQCDTGAAADVSCAGAPADPSTCGWIAFGDEVCECDCLAKEVLVSIAAGGMTNDPFTKYDMQLAFSGGNASGQEFVPGALRAVYTDNAGNNLDVNLRILQPDLRALTSLVLSPPLRLPNCYNIGTPMGPARNQHQPAIARVSASVVAAAYASNQFETNVFDIFVSAQGPNGCDDTITVANPLTQAHRVNMTPGGPASAAEYPAIGAGPDGRALVVWNQGGHLLGRIWNATDPSALTPTDSDIDLGSTVKASTRARVAGNADGWVVAYQTGGDDIAFKTVSTSGTAGSETTVNQATSGVQGQPDVAMTSNGAHIVVWSSEGNIQFQRYDSSGSPLSGDQDEPLSLPGQGAYEPAAAASVSGTGFYAVFWGAADGHIWGRFPTAEGGFGFNYVDGQSTPFIASHPSVFGPHLRPAVAVSEERVAVGWQMEPDGPPGLWVRGLPLPDLE
ncbi:MAG: hypothetical protein JRI68_19005 [Deltaproteobacteria bacterium]|nr:hypothetical protein [Deltaproteobacteria bacterium]